MNDQQLQKLVEKISMEYFNRPFIHKAVFNKRLRTTGGRYILNSGNIEINKKYYDVYGEKELIGIIKHELCHYHLHQNKMGYRHKDQHFRQLASQVGAPRYCTPLPEALEKNGQCKYININALIADLFISGREESIQIALCAGNAAVG